MTKEIKKAIEEVRRFHPTVTTVIFNKYGQWNYCDDNFFPPIFKEDEVDPAILEDAADSVEYLPCVYCI